jgi:hypothetical protein
LNFGIKSKQLTKDIYGKRCQIFLNDDDPMA